MSVIIFIFVYGYIFLPTLELSLQTKISWIFSFLNITIFIVFFLGWSFEELSGVDFDFCIIYAVHAGITVFASAVMN